jgi:Ca2+:H+ antiporter
VDSSGDEGLPLHPQESTSAPIEPEEEVASSEEEGTVHAGGEPEPCDDDEGDLSDAESFTLKDRQEAINETHPFGIRIWKPALYKKDRSVQKTAEDDVHSSPGGHVSAWLLTFNILWSVLFGWWLALISMTGAIVCVVVSFASESSMAYAVVLAGLAKYLINPFGKYVKLLQDEAYAEEDEGEGRSISEYEQWQSGDLEEGRLFFGPTSMSRSLIGRRRISVDSNDETQSLLGRTRRGLSEGNIDARTKRRLFGRGEWNVGRVVFFIFFYGLITPSLLLVSGICWLCVFSIPMGKVTLLLFDHLRRHPLALSFHSESTDIRYPGEPASSILLCTYRAVGWRYWKYTIDGTNIFLFNLLAIVAFTIFDYWVLDQAFEIKLFITSQGFIFALALFSIIPLAYFIGQAVASISAQSSMGVGATVNAFFSTIVEVFLYCVALNEGKHQLVEGSIIGSIFAGILFLPGISMCFGAIKRKTQRFNVKSAGVTSTMMLFAIIGAFSPTLFYQIYGSVSPTLHVENCSG